MSSSETITIYLPPSDLHQVHRQFSQTPEGIRLSNNTRFARYQNIVPNNKWQEMLGFDVNNLEHGRFIHGITSLFIKQINQSDSEIKFNPEEQKLLLLTAIVHDWSEGFTKNGDISYDQKTNQQEKEELDVIEQIIPKILGPNSLEIATKIKDILNDKTSKLGMTFNSIERIGYLRTALKAWEKSKITTNETIVNGLYWLTNNVLLNNIPTAINNSSIHPPLKIFLEKNKNLISEAFNKLPNSSFDNYETPQIKQKSLNQYTEAKNKWFVWIN